MCSDDARRPHTVALMGESVDDHTAREDLRTTFMRLDRVLAGLGWPRPPSATVQEHLRALSVDRLVESETLDAVAGRDHKEKG